MLQKNYNDATRLYELALDIAIEIEDRKGEAIILSQLATINQHLKKHRKALRQCKNAVEIFREIDDRSTNNEAIAVLNLRNILRILGNRDAVK